MAGRNILNVASDNIPLPPRIFPSKKLTDAFSPFSIPLDGRLFDCIDEIENILSSEKENIPPKLGRFLSSHIAKLRTISVDVSSMQGKLEQVSGETPKSDKSSEQKIIYFVSLELPKTQE